MVKKIGLAILLLAVLVGGAAALLSNRPAAENQANNPGTKITNPLAGKSFYAEPVSNASRQAEQWRTSRAEDARQMDRLAAMPIARWFGERAVPADITSYVQAADKAGQLPVLVAYNILNRDCGKYSAGGAKDIETYRNYIAMMAQAIGNAPAVVILEPDALSQIDAKRNDGQPCLSEAEKETYIQLTKFSVETLKRQPNTVVYIDAGNSGWMPDAEAMGNKLLRAGVELADGFSLNVSNFRPNDETLAYGNDISRRIGDKHFVVDTSRNGLGAYDNPYDPAYNWCNPPGRALGHYPTTETGKELVDAYMYIKIVGESDGADPDPQHCFGGPSAGTWMPEYALGLVQRWPTEFQAR